MLDKYGVTFLPKTQWSLVSNHNSACIHREIADISFFPQAHECIMGRRLMGEEENRGM